MCQRVRSFSKVTKTNKTSTKKVVNLRVTTVESAIDGQDRCSPVVFTAGGRQSLWSAPKPVDKPKRTGRDSSPTSTCFLIPKSGYALILKRYSRHQRAARSERTILMLLPPSSAEDFFLKRRFQQFGKVTCIFFECFHFLLLYSYTQYTTI